mmetsp:Transcript_2750/g.6213  ORF Transcript_2750/g.6213 Transcript_2750/m.6213 type:complete len:459 (-) Transcript_2750:765-2141(-)
MSQNVAWASPTRSRHYLTQLQPAKLASQYYIVAQERVAHMVSFLLPLLLLLGSDNFGNTFGFNLPKENVVSSKSLSASSPSSRRHNQRVFRPSLNNDANNNNESTASAAELEVINSINDANNAAVAASATSSTTADDDAEIGITTTSANNNADPSSPSSSSSKIVFLVSDGTGAASKKFVRKSLGQYDTPVQTRIFSFVKGSAVAASIVQMAEAKGAIIFLTITQPSLREEIVRMCALANVPIVDLIGPTLDALSSYFETVPNGVPDAWYAGRTKTKLSDNYFRRVEAVEFTLKADDGRCPWLLPEADVILLGVSRTGKTPLSVVLSQMMGLKVVNIPLVLECPPPKELFDEDTIDSRRVFCLTISPSELKRTRTTRLERRGVKATEEKYSKVLELGKTSNYNDRAYILKDLKSARDLVERHGWTQIDVTGRAVEETASYIAEQLNERGLAFLSTLDN